MIIKSIKTLNYSMFIDLGGTQDLDLNFHQVIEQNEMLQYPIMVAAAVGSKEFVQLLLKNKTIDFEVKD